MTAPRLKNAERWRFILSAGASIVQLRLPTAIRPAGRYTVVWHVRAGSHTAVRTSRVLRAPTKR